MSQVKRLFDVMLATALILLSGALCLLIAAAIKCTSCGPVLYWSQRVGRGNRVFRMPKFRSMRVGAPQTASHLLSEPSAYVTPLGRILRQTSLDELPQLFVILRGDMSFVGPRPALFNQTDLVALRTECGIQALVPGLTGWAQINGRDELSIPAKVRLDREYLERRSLIFDLKILLLTAMKVAMQEGVSH